MRVLGAARCLVSGCDWYVERLSEPFVVVRAPADRDFWIEAQEPPPRTAQRLPWQGAVPLVRHSTRRVKSHAPRRKHALQRRRIVGRVLIDNRLVLKAGGPVDDPAVTDDLIVAPVL